jgi:predicted  nucleic acid-binding Zn-ribbon protein
VHYWALFAAVAVFGVKYYTSLEMRKLEQRLNTVKDDLHLAKEKLHQTQERLTTVSSEEDLGQEQLRSMTETIEDIQLRMIAKVDQDSDEVLVSDSTPPPRTM